MKKICWFCYCLYLFSLKIHEEAASHWVKVMSHGHKEVNGVWPLRGWNTSPNEVREPAHPSGTRLGAVVMVVQKARVRMGNVIVAVVLLVVEVAVMMVVVVLVVVVVVVVFMVMVVVKTVAVVSMMTWWE